MARAAEAAGAGAIWAPDHLFWAHPTLECLTALAVAATATETAALGTCVLQLPLRSPAAVAKQAAALQALTGGRFVLGVGVGSHQGEYELAGADYARRGRCLDEGLLALRRAWGPATTSSTREHAQSPDANSPAGAASADSSSAGGAADYRLEPAAPVPVWVGGSSPAALRRAATLADGWVPLFCDPATFASRLAQVRALREAAGRDPGDLTAAVVLVGHVDDDARRAQARGTAWLASLYGIAPRAFERHLVAGPAACVADVVHQYFSAGADHVVVMVAADDPVTHFSALMAAAAPRCGTPRAAVPHSAMAGANL